MHLSDKDIPNPYASEQGLLSLSLIPSVIVTQLTLKLHQILDDEEAIFIPFNNLSDALDMAHNLANSFSTISQAGTAAHIWPDPVGMPLRAGARRSERSCLHPWVVRLVLAGEIKVRLLTV